MFGWRHEDHQNSANTNNSVFLFLEMNRVLDTDCREIKCTNSGHKFTIPFIVFLCFAGGLQGAFAIEALHSDNDRVTDPVYPP